MHVSQRKHLFTMVKLVEKLKILEGFRFKKPKKPAKSDLLKSTCVIIAAQLADLRCYFD